MNILAEDYGTGVYVEDFKDDYSSATSLINAWVSQETAGNIQGLFPAGAFSMLTRMVLVNAVHLHLPWDYAFDVSNTANASFTTANGTEMQSVSTPFMNQTSAFAYTDDGTAQVIWLPFGSTAQVAAVVALPHGDLPTYEAGLTTSSTPFGSPPGEENVQLTLPKVSFTSSSFSLEQPLANLGMTDAFDGTAANFSGLAIVDGGPPNLYVHDVIQEADIQMAEDGVQASAATGVVVNSYESESIEAAPVVMNCDHPYFFAIVDLPTGAILFMGHVADPTSGTAGGS